MLALDHLLFGNGHGMKSPHCDDVFFWLVDTTRGRKGSAGRLYTHFGGFGAQLTSYEWRMPQPGEKRRLAGETFRVFQARRNGPRVRVDWAWTRLPRDINRANAALAKLKARLSEPLASMPIDLTEGGGDE